MPGAVFVYPAQPAELDEAARGALDAIETIMRREVPFSWADAGTPGAFLGSPVIGKTDDCDYFAADLTRLTFNISYQVGYAIGRGKPSLITKNATVTADEQLAREVGLFGAIGHKDYQSGRQLGGLLTTPSESAPLAVPPAPIDKKSPVYAVLPKIKRDLEIHLISRVKKARPFFRTLDPEEQGRLSIYELVKNVAVSFGVIVPILPPSRKDAVSHNIRGPSPQASGMPWEKRCWFSSLETALSPPSTESLPGRRRR
jgi:hypothetical protein